MPFRVPRSSYYIGNDYQALVLYADSERITFNYTRTGNPVRGYTIYLEGVAVDSALVALYQQTNAAGRAELPVLQAGQGIARAGARCKSRFATRASLWIRGQGRIGGGSEVVAHLDVDCYPVL